MSTIGSRYKSHFLVFMVVMFSLVWLDWLSILSENNDSTATKFVRLFLMIYMFFFIVNYRIRNRMSNFFFKKPILLMLLVMVVYTIFSDSIIKNVYTNSRILLWILGCFYFFILFKEKAIKLKQFRFFIFSILVIMSILNIYLKIITTELTGINGYSYAIVWCFPLIFIFKRTATWYLVFGISILSVFYSIKRGAILSIVLATIAYYISIMYQTKKIKYVRNLIFGLVALFVGGYYAFIKNIDFYIQRFDDTTGSGRNILYAKIYKAWSSSDLTNILFGFGTNQTQVLTKSFSRGSRGIYAHSDWFQFLYDFGALGIFLIVFLHVYIIKLIRIGFKNKNSLTPVLVMIYIILFLVNIFSGQLIFANHMIFLSIALAFSSYVIYKPINRTYVNGNI